MIIIGSFYASQDNENIFPSLSYPFYPSEGGMKINFLHFSQIFILNGLFEAGDKKESETTILG